MKLKKNLALMFCLLAGIVVGTLAAGAASQVSYLRFLSYSQTVGISASDPFLLNLIVARIAFGFEMSVNIAQIICIALSLVFYQKVAKKL